MPFEAIFACCVAATLAAKSISSALESAFKIIAATAKEVTAATATPIRTGICPPCGAIAIIAMIDPGEAGARKPAPKACKVKLPVIPPAITAKNNNGFIMTYGK